MAGTPISAAAPGAPPLKVLHWCHSGTTQPWQTHCRGSCHCLHPALSHVSPALAQLSLDTSRVVCAEPSILCPAPEQRHGHLQDRAELIPLSEEAGGKASQTGVLLTRFPTADSHTKERHNGPGHRPQAAPQRRAEPHRCPDLSQSRRSPRQARGARSKPPLPPAQLSSSRAATCCRSPQSPTSGSPCNWPWSPWAPAAWSTRCC